MKERKKKERKKERKEERKKEEQFALSLPHTFAFSCLLRGLWATM